MEHCYAAGKTKHVCSCFILLSGSMLNFHTYSGGSALSPGLRHIAVYNLIDGLDLYAAGAYGKQKPRKMYKFNKPRQSKHALQVRFAHHGRALVCGTSTGGILLWEVRTGDALQELNHAGRMLLAMSS